VLALKKAGAPEEAPRPESETTGVIKKVKIMKSLTFN